MRWSWGNLVGAACLVAALGCGGRSVIAADGGTHGDAGPRDGLAGDAGRADAPPACDPMEGPAIDLGGIGGPCLTAADCAYDGAVCLTAADGFPGGLCTLACDGTCPAQTGAGMTPAFCVPGVGPLAGTGMCAPECDYAQSP